MTSQGQEQKLKGGFEVDLFVDQLGPEDRAVRAEAEQQRGGDLLGGPRDVPPEERQGVQARAVESKSLEVGKSLKIGKNRIKSEKSEFIFY